MKIFFGGMEFYRNTVPTKKYWASAKKCFDLSSDFCRLKTYFELLYHLNKRVNYLFRICFVHGSENEFNLLLHIFFMYIGLYYINKQYSMVSRANC